MKSILSNRSSWIAGIALGLLAPVMAFADTTPTPPPPTIAAVASDTIWTVVAAVLVMFMQAGFVLLEAGLTRAKNAGHIAVKNIVIYSISPWCSGRWVLPSASERETPSSEPRDGDLMWRTRTLGQSLHRCPSAMFRWRRSISLRLFSAAYPLRSSGAAWRNAQSFPPTSSSV